ncbi:MAG: hypothetical protein ATN34_00420 [Epulopiscium sp. Nele67-Bin002]|nr:MAG: hypothetical protein BEN18_08100 [Epulopiscium sp. Nuni2H_MBin001]OON91400.1 MAG: hypothetical protein ATN33_01295 [Epulopiscium sp. Nele67-Bin001]OON91570.1 MAG: hypothetical protein ATN34_00420 [Epulopiscium sp. Nele67-Bin002]
MNNSIQVQQLQMPQLREISAAKDIVTDKAFRFTLLSQIGESDLEIKLTQMVETITEQGKKISKHMDIRDIKSYRQMISEFMNEVTTNSHKFSRENTLDKRGRHRVYGIIRNVNDKLDELAEELMRTEKNQISILDKIGEIQGLILDLFT